MSTLLKLSQRLKQRKELNLEFKPGFQSKITFEGDNEVFTFHLTSPVSMTGSTKFHNLLTNKVDDIPSVEDCETVYIMGDLLDKFSDKFEIEESEGSITIKGYKGSELLLDVSKPKFNSFKGTITEPAKLWLRSERFADTPRFNRGISAKLSMKSD